MAQWSEHTQRVLDLAWQEADRFGHRYLGPEHLVLGVLRDGGSGAARVLEARGVDLVTARAALGRLADRGVVAGPRPSDAELLGMLGIDLEAIRRSTEQAFGGMAVGWAIREATRARGRGGGRVPRTPLGEPPMLIGQALQHAGEQARALGFGVVGPEMLLLGVVTDMQTPWPRCMRTGGGGSCTPRSGCRRATGERPGRCSSHAGSTLTNWAQPWWLTLGAAVP